MVQIAVFFFTLVLGFASNLVKGWALTKLWAWFVVPVFHLPVLSIVQGIGLTLVVGLATFRGIDLKAQEMQEKIIGDDDTFLETMGKSCLSAVANSIGYLMCVGIAYLWQSAL